MNSDRAQLDALSRRQSPGLVINGARYPVPGVNVTTWLDDPKRAPPVTDGYRREAEKVEAIVLHTSSGKLVGVKPGSRPCTLAESLAIYQARTERAVSWHLTIGTDGDVIQQCDLATWMAYHVETANGWTVGIELVQHPSDPSLYEVQLQAMVAVIKVAARALGIPPRVMVGADGSPIIAPVRALMLKKYGGRDGRFRGVIGHSHLVPTTVRGPGDPGPEPFRALLAAGFEGFPSP